MNAVEKVARVLFDAEWSITPWRTKPNWSDVLDGDRADYTAMARTLLAAFPQIALEGREEWASIKPSDRDLPFAPVVKRHATHARTVWESPWSEVQS